MFYVMMADGFEEAEAIVPLDLMRRAGIDAKTVGIGGETLRSNKGVRVVADLTEAEADPAACEGVFLPGGMPGMENLSASAFVRAAVSACAEAGKPVCAICAAPAVLGRMGLLRGRRAVCFPGFEHELKGCDVQAAPVCVDGDIITGQGAGCVFPFAHAIIARMRGKAEADRVLAQIRYAELAAEE